MAAAATPARRSSMVWTTGTKRVSKTRARTARSTRSATTGIARATATTTATWAPGRNTRTSTGRGSSRATTADTARVAIAELQEETAAGRRIDASLRTLTTGSLSQELLHPRDQRRRRVGNRASV